MPASPTPLSDHDLEQFRAVQRQAYQCAQCIELLVVSEDDAYWLDDDLPHVRCWQQRGLCAPQVAA